MTLKRRRKVMETKDKLLYVNINKEILNLCPDLRPDQVITLAEIIFNEFNYEVINNELERHIVGYLDDIGQGFKIIEEEIEEELED
tara:strand:- start:230 stop:487 length:258 start_codon:yes stop_codon:yes gene_type:complete